jgi:glycosyltransferase involved in cell wall biosynthesis
MDMPGLDNLASPTVSAVIPTYNRGRLLKEAIDSILRQTSPVAEIIVVDDGGTNDTQQIVRSYGDPVVLLTQARAGAAAARNLGVRHARGDWIAFLDSDDVWEPVKIERQLRYVELHPRVDLVHTGRFEFGDRDRVIPAAPHFLEGDYRVEYLLFADDWICTSSALVRRQTAVAFREWARWSQDIVFFADLLRSGAVFGYVDEPLVGYRVHEGSVNREAGSQVGGLALQWRWIAEAFASEPAERRRLEQDLLGKVIRAMTLAKWSRDWRAYWQWRAWLIGNWPSDLPRPASLDERIYPRLFYALRDRFGGRKPQGFEEDSR